MITFPVQLPSGAEIQVGGEPIGSDEKLKRMFPVLWTEVLSKDIHAIKNNTELERYCFHIVKHFNQSVIEDNFTVDTYSAREIIRIFMGQADDIKKKTGAV